MLLPWDDSLYAVDGTWLGPKGVPWVKARYVCYPIWAAVLSAVLAVAHNIGIPYSPEMGLLCVAASVGVTKIIGLRITADRRVRDLAVAFWLELTAEREPKPIAATVTVPRVRQVRRWR